MIQKLLVGLGVTGVASAVLVLVAGACSSNPASGGGGDDATEDAGGPGPCPTLEFPDACPTPPPSWKNDVKPLVVEFCDQCHIPGTQAAGQVLLQTYSEVAANRTRCWQQIYDCYMPNPDGSPAPFAYPTPAQRQTMVTWMDICNAPDN